MNGTASDKLTTEKYTIRDARNQREPAEYVQAIVRHAKGADIESIYNQLVFAHEGIAAELRVFLEPPTRMTTVADFITALELKKKAWFNLHSSFAPSQLRQQYNQPSAQRPSGFRDTLPMRSNILWRNARQPFNAPRPQQPNMPFQMPLQPTYQFQQAPNQQPSYQYQRSQQRLPQQEFSQQQYPRQNYPQQQITTQQQSAYAPNMQYPSRPTMASQPLKPYNQQMVPYNGQSGQSVGNSAYNPPNTTWNQHQYSAPLRPKQAAYQGDMENVSDTQDVANPVDVAFGT